jgi:hypothetical protein
MQLPTVSTRYLPLAMRAVSDVIVSGLPELFVQEKIEMKITAIMAVTVSVCGFIMFRMVDEVVQRWKNKSKNASSLSEPRFGGILRIMRK